MPPANYIILTDVQWRAYEPRRRQRGLEVISVFDRSLWRVHESSRISEVLLLYVSYAVARCNIYNVTNLMGGFFPPPARYIVGPKARGSSRRKFILAQ